MLPLWLAANWRLILAVIVGAALTWPISSCQGRRSANTANAAKIEVAASKVREAAAKAELAAMATDAIRRGQSQRLADELRSVADEQGTDDMAGPGVIAVLDRLREANRR